MAAIRGKDTTPEMVLRRALHKEGFRFRLQVRALPGRPDIVLPKYRLAIFVHGCFWHRHNCPAFVWPTTRARFWREKLEGNVTRDYGARAALRRAGWRTMVIWECELRKYGGPSRSVARIRNGISRLRVDRAQAPALPAHVPRAFAGARVPWPLPREENHDQRHVPLPESAHVPRRERDGPSTDRPRGNR